VSAISQGLRDFFRAQGVSSEQLQILEPTTAHSDHLSSYHRVDVALDSYPYHGTTTTCEALVMGVPVITLAGSVHRSRVGCSLLSNVGLPEFIARSEAEYVALAVSLAHDPSRLPSLRAGLRSKMQSSPLMDSARMARAVEGLFREEWVRWCARS
jgi:predicted O-linked N-acetylglucosamine transferase (SPINDLY family)